MGRDLFLLLSKGEGLVSAGFKREGLVSGWEGLALGGFMSEGLVLGSFGSFHFLVTTLYGTVR